LNTKELKTQRSYLIKENTEKDFLYFGLPCVWDDVKGKYLVFSPYSLKIAIINPESIDLNDIRKKLNNIGFFGTPARPSISKKILKMGLILTTDCNLRCKYCFVVPEAKVKSMSPEYAIRILKEKITPETEEIYLTFFGGEPTLNMDTLRKAVKHIEHIGIKTHFLINTNGMVSDYELNYLVGKNFVFVVSSDGVPKINDENRPMLKEGKSSKEIERTIKRLVKAGALFKVRATITGKSIFYLKESIDYWASLGVKFVHFEPVSLPNPKMGVKYPVPGVYIEQVVDAINKAERLGSWIISSPYMNLLTPSAYFCTSVAGENELYTPDGSISLCYRVQEHNHPFQEFIVGRYNKETDSFIRYSDRIDFLKRIDVSTKSYCDNCAAKYICGGGCPLRNKVKRGDHMRVDSWMCQVKKALVHDAIIRIDRALSEKRVPAIFGESIFENFLRSYSYKKKEEVRDV